MAKSLTGNITLYLLLISLTLFSCKTGIKKSELVSTKSFNVPVLKGKADNPVLRIACEAGLDEETVNAISLNLGDSKLKILKSIRIYYTGQDSIFKTEVKFGDLKIISNNILIKGSQLLEHGRNFFWVSYELTENASLTEMVSAKLNFIQTVNKKLTAVNNSENLELRTGVAVRQHGQDNVHTYRIPGLTTTNNGTLLAIYDVRRDGGSDLQGNIDIGVSRSIDGGNSWEPMRIALDMGEWGGLPQKFNGVSDANILVDRNTGDIFIAGLWMHGVINAEGIWQKNLNEDSKEWNHQWRNKGSQPGFGVKQTSQFILTKSTDDGQTWSKPINITKMCKKSEWWLWAPAPGHGITLDDGTLVFPTQGRDKNGETFSNITYSKDDGRTWKTSNIAYHNTTENMAVQLSDKSIMLNMRDNRNRQEKGIKNGRAIATTNNLGETWVEHETSHGALIECVCMASIHKHVFTDKNGKRQSVLFFSNPNSKYKRHKQTIKVSLDDGKTWPEKYWIELDEGRGAGYSCITSINENTIGILYEGSQAQMTFQAIDITNIIGK